MSPTEPPDAPYLEGNYPARPQAVRVVVAYDRKRLRVASEQRIDMRAPPSDPVYDYEGHSGSWFELRDAEGRVLYRRVTPIPIAQDLEAPSGDPKRPFTRVKAERRGTFVLTMPALASAREIVLFATPEGKPAAPAAVIGHIQLGKQGRPEKPKKRGGSRAPSKPRRSKRKGAR
jgi:hypothetical protein